MRPYRANRRPGNRPMTLPQRLRVFDSKELVCVACAVWAGTGAMPTDHIQIGCEYNHIKVGNLRVSHDDGYALCQWHHKAVPLQLWGAKKMRAHYGPSLLDGSALFHATYGTDQQLIELQNAILASVHGPASAPEDESQAKPKVLPQEEASQVRPDDGQWSEPA